VDFDRAGWPAPDLWSGILKVGLRNRVKQMSSNQLIARFRDEESGVAVIEYALLAALIAFVIVGAVGALGVKVGAMFDAVAGAFPT
jgi:pilus assembly protein Flp/PilA